MQAACAASGGAAFRPAAMRGHVPVRRSRALRRRGRALRGRLRRGSEAACRRLFFDLLWFRAERGGRGRGIVEQSTDTVAQAATLVRLFPEARFIHVVRDGRDASASRVAQTRGLVGRDPGPGDRVVGGADRGDRGGRRCDPAGAAADDEPRRARCGCRTRVALRPLFRFSAPTVTQGAAALLPQPDDPRGGERRALAGRDLGAQGGAARRPLRRGARPPRGRAARAARRCFAARYGAAETPTCRRWSTSTIEADEHEPAARGAGVRRRHRPQRHPHPLLPARPPLALSRGADRVPLSLQPEGARRRRHRRAPSSRTSSPSCAATGGTGSGSAIAPT